MGNTNRLPHQSREKKARKPKPLPMRGRTTPAQREKELLQRAARQYRKLPYHNWQHALGAAARGMEIARQCKQEGKHVNIEVVKWALLFHDAGYHQNHA